VEGFWTEDEAAFRRSAAEYFRRRPGLDPAAAGAEPAGIWRELRAASGPVAKTPSPCDVLSGRVSICDEASSHDPRLGRELAAWRAAASAGPADPLEDLACRLGRSAGTAAHVAEAGARAAREQGAFSSSLMACREVQESLAALVSGAGLVRFGACRLCRLLERGERELASREAAGLEARARALAADTRSLARSLLGDAWTEAHIPADDFPTPGERTP